MCAIGRLPKDKDFSGIIVKEENGHRFITPFNNSEEQVDKIEMNLRKIKAEIAERIEGKDKYYIKERVLKLNKEHDLPGVNSSLENT